MTNMQFVGRRGDGTITVAMPQTAMTREEALLHAAWLVTLADADDEEFGGYLTAVQGG